MKVEKGIPLPPGRASGKNPFTPILQKFEVGDSMFIDPSDFDSNISVRARLDSARAQASRVKDLGKPKRFVTRTRTENGKKGIRIWRAE